jgi:hypothetical protein
VLTAVIPSTHLRPLGLQFTFARILDNLSRFAYTLRNDPSWLVALGHDELVENELVQATWGLVIATALLVVAAIIPVLRDAADRRSQRRRISAGLVPDMIILRSRLNAACDKLAGSRSWSEEDIRSQIDSTDHELSMLYRIITQGDRPSLLFVNELYLVRHLLTEAKRQLTHAVELIDQTSPDDIRAHDEALRGARSAYKAALMSIDAATQLLPERLRTIDGEDFWDRINRVSGERESEAEKFFISARRSAPRSSGTEIE